MAQIYTSIEQLIGNTPLLELVNLEQRHHVAAKILGKLEYFNATGSVKDRIARAMIAAAEQSGELKPGGTIIEPTSGNTGIGLAALGAAKGYKVVIVMPASMSVERRKLMRAYGAKLVLSDGSKGMKGALAKANEVHAQTPNSWIAGQFTNPANWQAHYQTTGPEIWRDTDGKVAAVIAGVGTGGTITGVGKYLKEQDPEVKVIAVEPKNSPVLSGGASGSHKIQGIGAGFVPEVLDAKIYDEIIQVSDEDAISTGQEFGHTVGALVGISAGAAVWAAIQVAKRPEFAGKNIVVILPDSGDRYLSTPLFENGADAE